MNPQKHQQLVLPLGTGYDTGPRAHALFSYAEINSWIRELMPQLLDEAEDNSQLFDHILRYLSSEMPIADSFLEQQLNEELYGCLYGLKAIQVSLKHSSLPAALACLQQYRKVLPRPKRLTV